MGPISCRHRLLGDETDLFLAFHEQMLTYVGRFVPDYPAAAEEACAHAWSELLRRQPRRENVAAWLHVVARHEAIRLARRARREPPLTSEPVGATLHDALRARDALRLVGHLPERKRAVLGMQVAGYSHAEIAQRLQMTPRTVQRQLDRARATVRAQAA